MPSAYAELAVYQANVRRTFHYAVPDDLPVEIGQLVQVSFRTGLSQGIVLALTDAESCAARQADPSHHHA
jgi:sporulation-control protein spo0M